MIGDPASAPPRSDLPFLRRRSRPRRAAQAATPDTARRVGGGIDYTRHDRPRAAGTAPAQPAPSPAPTPPAPTPPAPARPAPTPVHPAGAASLDLSEPAPGAAPEPAPAPRSPAPPSAPAPASPGIDYRHRDRSASLDLSETPAAAPAAPTSRAPKPEAAPAPALRGARVPGREHHLLTRANPAAVLSKVQSGIGNLAVDALLPDSAGDFRLAALYELRSGGSSLVSLALGRRFGPPSGRRPVLVAGHEDRDERVALDLRQVRDIRRVAIVGFSESRSALTWGGTLVVTTFAGARIELPLEALYEGSTAVLLSLYNVAGNLVVRAEMETIAGDLRQAARAYGYDRITWRDDRTPAE